tara:strand:+ start:379 stop:555 length:177 start_codon:yes stop_codon:yes gene_type:complete
MWILALITATNTTELTVEHHKMYDFGPTCEYAAEARQLLLEDKNKKYVCVKAPREVNE